MGIHPDQVVDNLGEEELLKLVDKERLPTHVAIIMDGNGRWALRRGLPRIVGHQAGVKTIRRVVAICGELGIKILTLYTFSTENWKRSKEEVDALMALLEKNLPLEVAELKEKGIQLRAMGRLEELPVSVQREVARAIEATEQNNKLILILALNYSGRLEIIDALKKIVKEVKEEKLTLESIDEKVFSRHLYMGDLPEPDLLIRTSGEYRLSNFLLWQLAYTELWVTPVFWPDFDRLHFLQAIVDYQRRERRFGGVKD